MQRILLYEFLSSGGLLGQPDYAAPDLDDADSLSSEGRAMLLAVAADFAAIANVDVVVLVEPRIQRHWLPANVRAVTVSSSGAGADLLAEHSAQCDWTLLIAPEFDGLLHERSLLVERAGGRLLGPGSDVIALAADKQATAERLGSANIQMPVGLPTWPDQPLPSEFPLPAVLKPRDGAGSQDVRLIVDRTSAIEQHARLKRPGRLEAFVPGFPVSVAALCGPAENVFLPACEQRLSPDGEFRYLGGACPIPPTLNVRALELARRAIDAIPRTVGYLGVDMVLGDDPSGSGDAVIELNPRLTTSYVGLRAATTDNLAGAMLDVAMGRMARLTSAGRQVEFDSSGTVRDLGPV